MIPLKLSLAGLYSYQQVQEIDFQQLTRAELFGIFGATGSGKSSILEAISFALYNQTERLNSRETGGRAYHMMNLKSDRMVIDFECAAGLGEAERYRFRVECKRHRSKFEETGAVKRSAYHWQGGDWVPIETNTAEALIGLSYDHFKRTIIIPQGKFEEFIQLSNKDRSQMLQEIFGLEKYELSRQLRSLTRKNDLALNGQRELLGQYAQTTEDAVAANQAEIARLQATRSDLDTQYKAHTQQRDHMAQLREWFEQLGQRQQARDRLQQRQPEMQQRQQRLDRYLTAKDQFGEPLSEHRRLSQQLEAHQKRLLHKRDTATTVQEALTLKQKTFQDVEQQYQQREQLLRQAEELEQVLQLKQLSDTLANKAQRVDNGQTKVKETEAKIRSAEAKVQTNETALAQLEQQRPDTQQLLEVNQWYAERKRLAERLHDQDQALRRLRGKVDEGKEEKARLARQVGIDLSDYQLSTNKLIERLDQQQAEHVAQRKRLERDQQHLLVRQQMAQLADNLSPGDPCPLCGATEHPAAAHGSADEAGLKRVREEMERLDLSLNTLRQTLPALQTLLSSAKGLHHEQKQVEADRATLQREWDLHQSRFVWQAYRDDGEAQLKQRLAAGQQVEQQIKGLQQQLKDLRDAIRAEQVTLQEWRPTLDQLNADWRTLQGEFNTGRKALRLVTYDDYVGLSDAALRAQVNELRRNHEGIARLHDELTQQINEKKDQLATLKGEINSLDKTYHETAAEVARLHTRLEAKVVPSPFDSVQAVRETLDLALDIDAEKELLRRFQQELTEAETSLRDLQRQVEGQHFDPEAFAQLATAIQALEAQSAAITQQIGGKVEYGERLTRDLAEKQRLTQAVEQLEYRADNLKVLNGLLRGNGFVNYLSTAFLENLCAAANARFLKLSNNSLSLEVDADNNFHVRDLLSGGRRRSIKTLSGGQTFQAALCLALALSDQVQQQVQAHQNFFFLDEGFGSQDRQSLQTIFRTLKSLRQENRIVGVISHVEELQQEIDTHLRIVNHPETGSQVHRSWEG
jgi:exonuclease SbcC